AFAEQAPRRRFLDDRFQAASPKSLPGRPAPSEAGMGSSLNVGMASPLNDMSPVSQAQSSSTPYKSLESPQNVQEPFALLPARSVLMPGQARPTAGPELQSRKQVPPQMIPMAVEGEFQQLLQDVAPPPASPASSRARMQPAQSIRTGRMAPATQKQPVQTAPPPQLLLQQEPLAARHNPPPRGGVRGPPLSARGTRQRGAASPAQGERRVPSDGSAGPVPAKVSQRQPLVIAE
ncbi:unnamed protein product, partial [Polarella glacialis]